VEQFEQEVRVVGRSEEFSLRVSIRPIMNASCSHQMCLVGG